MQAAYGPHAGVHGAIGSSFGCDAFSSLNDLGYFESDDALMGLCRKWGFILKELYRSNIISVNTDCDASAFLDAASPIDYACGFTCTSEQYDNAWSKIQGYLVQQDINFDDYDSDDENNWSDFVCGGKGDKIFPGDHLESASAAE